MRRSRGFETGRTGIVLRWQQLYGFRVNTECIAATSLLVAPTTAVPWSQGGRSAPELCVKGPQSHTARGPRGSLSWPPACTGGRNHPARWPWPCRTPPTATSATCPGRPSTRASSAYSRSGTPASRRYAGKRPARAGSAGAPCGSASNHATIPPKYGRGRCGPSPRRVCGGIPPKPGAHLGAADNVQRYINHDFGGVPRRRPREATTVRTRRVPLQRGRIGGWDSSRSLRGESGQPRRRPGVRRRCRWSSRSCPGCLARSGRPSRGRPRAHGSPWRGRRCCWGPRAGSASR